MSTRRTTPVLAVAAATALSLSIPAAAQAAPPGEGTVEGFVASFHTKANRVVLTDGQALKIHRGDLVFAQHYHDYLVEDGYIDCDLTESSVDALLQTGAPVRLRAYFYAEDVTSFMFSADTCDGVIDEADAP